MNYTLHQLQVFMVVAKTGSITQAADELHLTQPAVSIQLKNFQNQFDIALTEVIGRKLYVTDFGKEIAAAAESILNQVYAIDYRTKAHKGQLAGRLKISVVSTGKYVMPYFISGFINKHPGVELSMDVTNKQKVVESLEKNEVDFSLVSILPDKLSFNKINLVENDLYLVGHQESKFRKGVTTKELLSDLPLIFREPGSGTRQTMELFLRRHHLHVRKKLELTSNEAVKQSVIAGIGYSIMPMIGIKNEVTSGLIKIITVKGLPIRTVWQLIWPKGKKLSPIASELLNHIEQHKTSIISQYFKDIVR